MRGRGHGRCGWVKEPRTSVFGHHSPTPLPPQPFRTNFAVSQLFHFALKYREEIYEALPADGSTVTKSDFDVLAKPPHR